MFYRLTEALKRQFILELRRYWAQHPAYPDIVDNIQGKYSFEERPQYGIVVKTGSASKVQLSADNFMGHVESYVLLAHVPDYPGLSIEWIKEDSVAIQNNNGVFPSLPGAYFIEITGEGEFHIDPYLDVHGESPLQISDTVYSFMNVPYEGSLNLFEYPSGQLLKEGVDYTFQSPTEIALTNPLPSNVRLSADYRYQGQSTGPWHFKPNTALTKPIPGCVLAFGRRSQVNDRMVVIVQRIRELAYLEYGGRWDISLDMDIIARDVFSQQEISDQTLVYLWGVLRSHLSTHGIEITDVSFGGESEEIYDENADDYFYNGSISIQVQTDWFIHVPVVQKLKSITTQLQAVESLGLNQHRDPFFFVPGFSVIR